MKHSKYLIIIEPTKTGYSAYSPDLPGCITVGDTVEDTVIHMQEAIELYVEQLIEIGQQIPASKEIKENITFMRNLQSGAYMTNILA